MNNTLKISIIIPVYNSSQTLAECYNRLKITMVDITEFWEIIFVDDGSIDNSWETINNICKSNKKNVGIKLKKNYGQHNALLCGIRQAKYDYIITMDDDLQNPPEEIPVLIKEIQNGYDVVYGYPREEKHGFLRNLASIITKIALKATMGIKTARHVSAFRIFRTNLRESFTYYRGSFVSIDVLLSWSTNSFNAIPVKHLDRFVGYSNYTVKKLINHAFNMITGFSVLPLQIASIIGFLFSIFGFIILFFVLARYFIQGSTVQGFPFLASIVSIFSGAQLLAIGIIGEYLSRMHFRTMDKPQYFIGEKLNLDSEN